VPVAVINNNSFNEEYKVKINNKVLITGAGGFIGSALCERCIGLGFRVRAFVHYNSKNSRGWLEWSEYRDEIEFISGDIRDYDSVYGAMKGCDTVFHLAALIGIPYSYVSPLAYIKTNVEGCYNVLQASRELDIKNILITSTSETYGTAQYIPIDEKHPIVGQSPYSATKIAADQLAISYFRSFNLPVKIVRPFNTYGPRQSARAIIPTIITQLLNGKNRILLGNLQPTRDLTFVKDTVEAFIEIARSDLFGWTINIGMNQEINMGDLALMIAKLIDINIVIDTDQQRIRPLLSEVERLRCDNTIILEKTNWRPKYDLEKGLSETIDWFRENYGMYKSDIYNI
jgi:NAD dependent epimerase/dehydratase